MANKYMKNKTYQNCKYHPHLGNQMVLQIKTIMGIQALSV